MKRLLKPAGFLIFLLAVTALPAQAARYDIKEMTPEVSAAIASRQAHFAELRQLKRAGALGENSRGYVEGLKSGGNAAAVAAAENSARGVIYRTIVAQNNLGPEGLGIVETVFAEVQSERAAAGDFIQHSSGEWVRK